MAKPLNLNDPSTWMWNSIEVNDFMFCAVHGNEWCYRCTCDHRTGNNIRIEKELEQEFTEEENEGRDDRRPIMNVFAMGSQPSPNNKEEFQCTTHKKNRL
ncbi:hypothetical protein BKA70DRAFT_1261038 [Coprinopsis sp. MPI-PUGE-AT-0042]|nr:hypothetical protein BKA70DRAFT_1261038 [Coprinopsis sp. MPI-PUGE-AT-0042]